MKKIILADCLDALKDMESNSEYFEIAQKRLSHISKEVKQHKERVEERVALF